MKTIIALVTALSFAAPLAAIAAPQTTAQKVQQTYHLHFQNNQAEAIAGGR